MQVHWMIIPSFPTLSLKPLFSSLPSKGISFPISEQEIKGAPTLADDHKLTQDAFGDLSVPAWPCSFMNWIRQFHSSPQGNYLCSISTKDWEIVCPFQLWKCTNSETAEDLEGEDWVALHEDRYRACWTQDMATVIAICTSLPFHLYGIGCWWISLLD